MLKFIPFKSEIDETENQITITIPNDFDVHVILLRFALSLPFLILGLLLVSFFIYGFVLNLIEFRIVFPPLFETILTIGIALIDLYFVKELLWLLFGKEILIFDKHILIKKMYCDILCRKKTYQLSKIINISLKQDDNPSNNFETVFGSRNKQINSLGTIRFNYEFDEIDICNGILENEARFVLEKLVKKGFIHENQLTFIL